MNILMLLEVPFPPDIRVQKEAGALIDAGHNVSLLCPLRDGESNFEEFQKIAIYRFNTEITDNYFRKKISLGYRALTFRIMRWA